MVSVEGADGSSQCGVSVRKRPFLSSTGFEDQLVLLNV
jgi:hypothetical protein